MKTQISINIPVWMLLGLLVVILFIFMIIRINNKDKKISKKASEDYLHKDESSLNWIEKKDLLYWLIIICLGTISIFTFKYRKASEVINHWGFAGTIISIILAVLAIIYTYYQSATTVDSTKRLEKSAKKVQKATTRVEEATKELENSNIDSIVTSLESRITELINNVQVGIDDKLSDHHNELKGMFETNWQQKASFDKSLLNLSQDQWVRYISEKITENTITLEGIVLLHIFYKNKLNLKYNIHQIGNWALDYYQSGKKLTREVYSYTFFGILNTYRSFGIIDYKEEGTKLVVEYFSEDLNEVMEKYINDKKIDEKESVKKIINDYK